MSNLIQQQHSICSFTSSDNWAILSPIEQNIKRKIEAVGTPLKDWGIHIYRGILTGCNEAFIISTQKRDEILSNCKGEEERHRTAELIRPILRGRDIKRYSYAWADLWLIAIFPSRHYNIEDYPAVKDYLLNFGIERLEQTGETHIINGKNVRSRKKTNNKWFEIQDSINYWEDFNKPKILWKRIGSILRFSYDNKKISGLDSTCFATGNHIFYLCCILNSLMGHYLLKDSPKTGTGDLLISVQAVEPLIVPYIAKYEDELRNLLYQQINNYSDIVEQKINQVVFTIYGLSSNEIKFIQRFVTQSQQSQ